MGKYLDYNGLSYLWDKIKLYLSSALSTKVDKISSTDNAAVRFNGEQGAILNSGVIIDDNNNVTAAKFIKSGGTSSLFLKADGSVDTNTYLKVGETSSHTHGNISNTGTLTDTAAASGTNDQVVIRDSSNNKIQTSTIKGTDVEDAISKKHAHSNITLSKTAQAYDGTHTIALPSSDPYTSARTPSSHTHGNIQNGGTLQTNDVTIANGDKLVVTDSSDSSKIARTSVSFDGSTTTKALTPKGTWVTFLQTETDPTVPAWAKASSKPTYNLDEVSDGSTRKLSDYVKYNPGASEQTIKSSISSLSKGVVNLWRNSGDHYTFLGFSNGTTETYLGGIGFLSQSNSNLYHKDKSGNYYKILDENNWTGIVDGRYLKLSGGTMTGALTLNGAPTSNLHAATKKYVDDSINALPEPMLFKGSLGTDGTITSLPTAATSNEGFTYKVITAGTYANQAAKIGDTFISDGSKWVLIPSGDEPSGTVTSITLKATSPIAIDNTGAITTSGTRTFSHSNSGVTAGTYESVTVNATGHVTAGTNPTKYWANVQVGTAANYITEPEVKTIKINGSTTNSASTTNCVLQFDTTNQCLKFVFN